MVNMRSMLLTMVLAGCSGSDKFEFPNYTPVFTVVADDSDGVDRPQDLDFHPAAERANELWVVNKGTEETGSDMVIIHDAGLEEQDSELRMDDNAYHFMNLVSAFEFSDNGNWANAPEITDANHSGGTFTGPSLWSSNLDIFARPSGGNGSHLDMLHQSPNAMGIAHEVNNVFWIFDGYNSELVRYNFADDHGPGQDDHSDGGVKRFSEVPIQRVEGTPSHMVLDKDTDWLYIADSANGRILRMDIESAENDGELPPQFEELRVHLQMRDEVWEVFAEGLTEPSGIELSNGVVYVSDASTGEIVGFDVETTEELGRFDTPAGRIAGIKVGPDNNLWYVDRREDTVVRVDRD